MPKTFTGLNMISIPSLDNERFFIEYSDGAGRWEPFTMYWNVNDKSISKFWKRSLYTNYLGLDNRTQFATLDKRYMNRGFVRTKNQTWTRDIKQICSEVNNAIDILNSQLHNKGYPHIDLHFTPERVWDEKFFRDDFNQLHHHFEVLIGQVWNISNWYTEEVDNKGRWAIHCLNNACHEIESLVDGVITWDGKKNPFVKTFGWTGISFNSPSWDGMNRGEKTYFEYREEDYNDWETEWFAWGALLPYYSQLGKNLREVFEDGDDYIDDGNISSHCLMTGECNICLTGPGTNGGSMLSEPREREFKTWLAERGFDYHDPKVGAGYAVMGTPAMELFPDEDWKTLDDKIKRCDNITAVGFVDRSGNIQQHKSRRYDYTWQEQYAAEIAMFEHDSDSQFSHIKTETTKPWYE